jgi:asparagine synthase (glutamine-hydrolysing)
VCGIVGVVDYEGRFSTPELVSLTRRMRDQLTHRGPDDSGLWTSADGRVCLGHRRLAVIDLRPEGRQPMLNEDGRVALTFNGEIYNFQGLRTELLAGGHRFRSRGDTEVLCHLMEDEPEASLARLQGQFAFAAWNSPRHELFLARDAFGEKPLYYSRRGAVVAFASELRPLTLLGDLHGDVDPVAVQEYLLLQYIHAPRTIYRNCRKLEPGSYLALSFSERHHVRERCGRFFQFRARDPVVLPQRGPDLVESLRQHLIEAMRNVLVADVPLGAFLSGGNDSSLVVAMMARELGVHTKTYSIGFTNTPSSEHLAARQIAAHLGTEHHELLVEPSAVDLLPTIAASLDEPNGDSSCLPVYLLSRFAREHVTVALSGDGGDEVFGGYGRYTDTVRESRDPWSRLRWLKHYRRWWRPATAYLGWRILPMTADQLTNLAGRLEPETKALLDTMHAELNGPGPVLHRMRNLDVAMYMPGAVLAKVDRMSMRFALEVRCPLLDTRLANWAARLPADTLNDGHTGKKLLKQLALRYLPAEIVNRPKQGFGLPDQCWSHDRLLNLAEELLLGSGGKVTAFLDKPRLRRHLQRQRDPGQFHVYQVWELLILEQWLRTAAESPSAVAA